NVVVAGRDSHVGAVIAEMLSAFAEDGADADLIIAAQGDRSDQMCPCPNNAPGAERDGAFQNGIRPNLDIVRQLSSRIDDRRRMDACHGDLPVPRAQRPTQEIPKFASRCQSSFFRSKRLSRWRSTAGETRFLWN